MKDKPNLFTLPVVLCLLLVALTLAVYWPVLHCDFVNYDDPDYFTANPHVLAGLTPGNLAWALSTGDTGNWHPLTWLSLMLDVDLFGPGPAGPHGTNLLFHLVNTVLLFRLLRRWLSFHSDDHREVAIPTARATWCSALAAALFALHPTHVESVAWVAERKDVLSTCFGLLSLLFYTGYAQKRSGVEGRESRADITVPALDPRLWTLDYALALLFFALSLMSKPMLVTLPLVMLLLDWWPLRRSSEFARLRCAPTRPGLGLAAPEPEAKAGVRNSELNEVPGPGGAAFRRFPFSTLNPQLSTLLFEKWPFFLLSVISCAVTFLVQEKKGAVVALAKMSLTGRLENTFVAYARYLGKTFWPAALSNPYPFPGHWPPGFVLFSAILVIGLSVTAFWLGRKLPAVPVGWFWFVGTLVPVIGLVQVGTQSLADRYTYWPQIGIFLIVAWGLTGIGAKWRWTRPVVGLLAAGLLVACGLRTRDQIGYWQNSGTLFSHALALTENNYVACNNLGTWFSKNGQTAQARECFRRSLQINPDNPDALYNLGNTFANQGDWDEAIADYRRALALTPDQADILNNLGFALATKRQFDDAIACFEAALKLNPDSASTHNNLAAILFQEHRLDEAVQQYREALRITPNDPRIYVNLGDALMQLKKPADAVLCYQAALRLSPDDPQIRAKLRSFNVPD